MNAQKLADELKALGINVINVTEPQEHEDGIIAVTNKVHVQVPMMVPALFVKRWMVTLNY